MKSKSQVKKGAGKLKKGNGPFSGPLAKALQYESAGNWIAAKSIYRDVIRDSPDHAEANFKLASLLNQERQYALALEHWEKALRAGKTDLFARLGYGLCLFE
ncbi:MAG: hypothetical protein OEU86_05840, partial [Gammaproteobacteria bacterium]|nr:hypothetical protein [Gammaproteobacteria bacterium]